MNPLIHFLVSVVAGLGIGLHHKRKYTIIIVLAAFSLFVDLDHFLGSSQRSIHIFHNVFFFITFPLIIFLIFYLYEVLNRKGSTKLQRISLLFLVMLVGHMFIDGIDCGAMALYYPLTTSQYVLTDISLSLHPYFSLTSEQTLLLIFGVIILIANLIETRIYKRHEGFYEDIFALLEYPKQHLWRLKLKKLIRRALGKAKRAMVNPSSMKGESTRDI
jgi:hypothetical protein